MGDTADGSWGSRELGQHIAKEKMKMSRVPTEAITTERLARWTKRLEQNHATPVILVAMGHDEVEGQLVICTVEDISDTDLAHLLLGAARKLHP